MTAAAPAPPPSASSPFDEVQPATPRGRALLDALALDRRAAPTLRRYVILDGARDPAIHAALEKLNPPRTCLFAGELPVGLEAAAPWLVDVEDAPRECVTWLVDEVWGTSAGVWVVGDGSFGEVRKQLRRFLRVRGPSNGRMLFRYYDPRVLRLFLPLATPAQRDLLFGGGLLEWSMEDDAPGALLRFGLTDEGPLTGRVSLADATPPPPPAAAPPPPAPEVDGSGTPEEVAARLRGVLAAHAGEPKLVATATAVPLDAAELARADALRDALAAARAALTPSAVAAALRAGPAPRSWERPYLALVPRLHGRLTAAERARLRASSVAVREATEVVARAETLRQQTRDIPEGAPGEEAAGKILEELRRHQTSAQAWGEAADPQLEPVVQHLKRLVTRLELRKTVDGKAVGSGLASFLLSLKSHLAGGERAVERAAAEALTLAVDGTRAEDADAPPAHARPAPRKGRVPPRRQAPPADPLGALPGRESFVVSSTQLSELSAACDRALQLALERHAREHHAERAAALGDRLPALATRCRERAARHGIQRRSAVIRLFDLMIGIDPEFQELDPYHWARELLENDLVDPDAKPDMIHARIEAEREAP
jgi:hypothetical protein